MGDFGMVSTISGSLGESSGNGPSIVNGCPREGERQPFAKYNAQIDEVLVIMQDNVNKVMERGEAMDNLENRADNLQLHSNQFERHSRRVQNKMLMQNLKGWLITGLIVSVLLTILIVIFHSSENSPGDGN